MKFTIPCATYARFAAVCAWAPPAWPQAYIKSLYVERKGGKLLCVATNVKVAAIEMIGPDAGPDDACFVAFDGDLLQQATTERDYASSIEFDIMKELAFGAAKTTFGYQSENNIGVFPAETKIETATWRNWLPDSMPSESYGHMSITCSTLSMLAEASPSGTIIFPTHIDTRLPCVVRDSIEKNWLGVFMPMPEVNKKIDKFTIPNW